MKTESAFGRVRYQERDGFTARCRKASPQEGFYPGVKLPMKKLHWKDVTYEAYLTATRLLSAFALATALFLVGTLPARADGTVKLENGLIKVSFRAATGSFDFESLPDHTFLLSNGAPGSLAGQTISSTNLEKVETKQEPFEDQLGRGEKLVVHYTFRDHTPGFRYEICLYSGKPWLSITAFLPRGDYTLGDFSLLKARLHVPEAFRSRVYVNSGEAGGNSGTWELGMRAWSSANLSAWYDPNTRDALQVGFYSFYRARTSVASQYLGPHEIGIDAAIHYNGFQPKDQDLRTESALLSFGRDPLQMLEDWADAGVKSVHPQFSHDTRTGYFDVWYAFGDKASSDDLLEQAKILRKSVLYDYGITFDSLGEWQKQRHGPGDSGDALGYGEDEVDTELFPQGLEWLCRQYHDLGFGCTYGANYAYAAWESSLAKKNVPWLVKADRTRMDFGMPIDFTDPGAQKWVFDLFHRADPIGAKWVWTDFDGGPARGPLHDPTKIRGFEDVRAGMKAIRDAVGPATFVHKFCCGQYFSYLGLADRVRVGNDMFGVGDFDGLREVARQLAANYMLHQRFWINDPDPIYVGGRDYVHNYGSGPIGPDPAILDEVRMRLQLEVTSGGFVTLGNNVKDLDPERVRLLTLVLPPYGQAGRPLDLFSRTVPEVYDLKVKTDWDEWHVLMLQNWEQVGKTFDIRFSQLGLDESDPYLVFRFWDQAPLGEYRTAVPLKVGARQGETYVIRRVPQHPWVLSTDMHLTQGGVELRDVRWDAARETLTGVAERHPGADGQVVVYAPAGYEVLSASGEHREASYPGPGTTSYIRLKFASKAAPWAVTFRQAQ